MVEPYLVACGLLLLGSVLARALPVVRRSFDDDHEDGWDLDARALAYLRAGRYGVVLTVLAELHGEGAVEVSDRRVRRLDPPRDCDDRLAVAVYSGLTWTRRPRLLALLPRLRRACAPLRWELRDRALLAPPRRRVLAAVLRLYAVGLAAALVLEQDFRGSSMLAAASVGAAAVLLRGPRRTVAGMRELALHRAALARVAADGPGEAAYLPDLVAAYGTGALRVLCTDYVAAGALAPPAPSYEPRPAGYPGRVTPVVDPGRLTPVVERAAPPVTPAPVLLPGPRLELVVTARPGAPRSAAAPVIFVPVEPPEPIESAVLRQVRIPVAA